VRQFTLPLAIQPADIDGNAHVNHVVYLRWINDVAVAHWMAYATPAMRDAYAWFATRHEIDYRQQARLGEEVEARTWIGTVDSRRMERHTVIVRLADEAVLARGRTLWTLVDRASGKVTRIPDAMAAMFEAYRAAPA
jgi:acyl-CoA thioester hydrolase